MDTYEAIVTKRDRRSFRPDPVDDFDLHRIPQAARMAGSAKNEQVNRLGRMAQNMMVMANSLGLASCPMTFHDEGCARDVLGLPDDLTAPMGVAVGRPGEADPNRKSSPRVPLDELVRWGRWSG